MVDENYILDCFCIIWATT